MRVERRRVDGVLLLDKPSGITSNAALQRVKRAYRAEKAGHTGTLDPLASGLLPICFGEATKFAQFLLDAPKRYRATIRFGVTTATQDAEGAVQATAPVAFEREALVAALRAFVGRIEQAPPAYSALKHEGRPLYSYARAGIEVAKSPRVVDILGLDLVEWSEPDAVVDVACSKGTYVRTLAADLGTALGCGAHLAALRRTATGGFDVADAVALAPIEAASSDARDELLRPSSALLAALPALELDEETSQGFRHGRPVLAQAVGGGVCAVFAGGKLLGVARVEGGFAHPRRLVRTPPDHADILE
jgi:tRNA pseudouridine55 synthase